MLEHYLGPSLELEPIGPSTTSSFCYLTQSRAMDVTRSGGSGAGAHWKGRWTRFSHTWRRTSLALELDATYRNWTAMVETLFYSTASSSL